MTRSAGTWWRVPLLLVIVGFAFSAVQPTLARHRDIRMEAIGSLLDPSHTYMGDPGPAIRAARRLAADPRAPIYDQDLSVGSAFIYPPIAAAMYRPLADLSPELAQDRLAVVNHVLWCVIVLLVARMAGGKEDPSAWMILASLAACVVFYPLVHAVELNQATVVVTLLVGLAWVALDDDRHLLGGVALAAAMAIKPQLGLMLPVLLLAGARRMVIAAAIAATALALASVLYAGTANNAAYVTRVLPALSRGYPYYANQGYNGLLYRLIPGGDIGVFVQQPRSLVVDVLTLVAGIGGLVAAASVVRRTRMRPPSWAFGVAWLAATMASPVAWQHHFAPALFAFALLGRSMRHVPALREPRIVVPAAAAFTLMAVYFEVRGLQRVPERLLVSYVLAGASLLGVALVRASLVIQGEPPAAGAPREASASRKPASI